MADTKLTVEQSMEESKVLALKEIVNAVHQLTREVQGIRVQVTNLAAAVGRK